MKKNVELGYLQDALNLAKEQAKNTSLNGSDDRTIWTDFTKQLGKLNWNKLSDTSGVNQLANDLKNMVETDFPNYSDKWEIDKYEDVIYGYINRQGLFDENEDAIGMNIAANSNYLGFIYNAGGSAERKVNVDGKIYNVPGSDADGTVLKYSNISNKRHDRVNLLSIPNRLEKITSVSKEHFDVNSILSYNALVYGDNKQFQYSMLNLKNIINSANANPIAKLARNYQADSLNVASSLNYNKQVADSARIDMIKGLLELPPIQTNQKASVKFMYGNNLKTFATATFKNELGYINNGIISDSNQKAFISNTDIAYLRKWVGLFYDDFYNKIDFNSPDENWVFDKDDFTRQLVKVESFAHKLKDYVEAYDSMVSNPENVEAQIRVITLYNEIREQKDNPESYYENINVKLKQSMIDLWDTQAEATAKKLTEWAKKLKLYDVRNEVIKGVITTANELKMSIDKAQKAVDAKQDEIDKLNKQIKDLALTPEEQGATDLKRQKEQELANKQAEKIQLEQDRASMQAEFDEITRQLNETNLANLGKNSVAIGSNAFASGNDSVAIGTNSTAQHKNSIIIGTDSVVTALNSVAIGANNTVSAENTFVLGGNVNADIPNSVVLGANSTVAQAVATPNMRIKDKTYQFAGKNPVGVVSVGSEDQERTVTHVAAGQISETSTDAINGSQLYSVIDALGNQLDTKFVAGDNITFNKDEPTNTVKITGKNTQSIVKAGQGITVQTLDNLVGTKDYTVSTKLGEGLSFDDNGAIRANGTTLHAGENVEITGDVNSGYTISSKTQIINGGKATVIHAGDNVRVTGDVDNGFTVSVENMRSNVTGGQGTEVTSSTNDDGSKNYIVNLKIGDGLTYDDKGNLINDMKLTAGENVQVSGNAKGGYTISATDTNTQATVSADKGITITETNNANGTKNYAVSAKLGKGLKVDENGAIAATAQPINGGVGVSITTNVQDEAVVNVVGVKTTTDDGKSYARSDLTKSVGIKGDRKNIHTTTAANGDVQVNMSDDLQVNSVSIHNGPNITQNGINANNTRITNVQDGVSPTDAVNVRQLNQQGNVLNQRIDNLANNVKKNKKRADAGIAATAAMSNIPQVMLAGKSGIGVGVGNRSGQTAVAVGYSRASDNAKHIIKLSAGVDTQSKATFGAGYMYQW